MRVVRHIASALLVALLAFSIGVGAGHALSMPCAGGHCDEHAAQAGDQHHADHIAAISIDGESHGSDGAPHERCDPVLCNVLVLPLYSWDETHQQSEAIWEWRVGRLLALEKPDHPDRPPNL